MDLLWKGFYGLVLAVCCALVLGCSGPAADSTGVGIEGQAGAHVQASSIAPAVSIPTFTRPAPTTSWLLPTETASTPRGDPSPVSTPWTSETEHVPAQEVKVCSPLVDIPLEELPQIISEPYHPPPPGREERHHGVDFSYYRRGERLTIQGTRVQAILPGVVALALEDKFPYGNMVIIETSQDDLQAPMRQLAGFQEGESLFILYAHMEGAPLVKAGERVEACEALGAVGKSGNAGVAHLHLEMRRGLAGSTLAEMSYYIPGATEEEKTSYLRWRISGEFNHFDPMLILRP